MRTSDIPDMFYTAPALLHPLVRKCHNADYEIPAEIGKMLDERGITVNGTIPENIKQYILRKITLTEDGGISIRL
jgi:hypothetical protein